MWTANGYWMGCPMQAAEDDYHRRMLDEERRCDAMRRMSRLTEQMALEFGDEGKTPRFWSLAFRADALRFDWNPVANHYWDYQDTPTKPMALPDSRYYLGLKAARTHSISDLFATTQEPSA